MADEILNVRADAYRACILLDALPTMTLEKFRKLVRLMTKYPEDNRDALEQLGRWLEVHKAATELGWKAASQQYVNGWKLIRSDRGSSKIRMVKAENERLAREVRRTKAAYTKAAKMAEIYQSMI